MKALALLLLLPIVASANPYKVFNIDFSAGGGIETVSGYIDLVPGAHGQLVAADITAWSLSSLGAFLFSYSGNGALCSAFSCGLIIQGNALLFSGAPGDGVAFGQYVDFGGPGGRFPNPEFEVANNSESFAFYIEPNTHIGTRAVPEPATLALLGLGLFGVGLRRCRLARWPRSAKRSPTVGFSAPIEQTADVYRRANDFAAVRR